MLKLLNMGKAKKEHRKKIAKRNESIKTAKKKKEQEFAKAIQAYREQVNASGTEQFQDIFQKRFSNVYPK